MTERGTDLGALREAIEALAAGEAPGLVAEARAEARAKVRAMLTEAIAESLLAHSAADLGRPGPAQPRPARATRSKPGTSRPSNRSGKSQPKSGRRSTGKARTAPAPRTGELGCYVYGIVARGAELPGELAGVDPRHSVTVVGAGELAAITSRVSLDEFGEDALHENLNDVEWLEQKARTHELVLDAVLAQTTVVPMRLCTIYTGQQQVHEMLVREHDLFAEALRYLSGRAEWGVKLITEPGALDRIAAEGGPGKQAETSSPGAAYLDRKRRLAHAREVADNLADAWADAAHERLAKAAVEALLNPLQPREVSGFDGEMLLNGVYLVNDDGVEEFRNAADAVAEDYRDVGVSVDVTGPWPAYNFVKSSIEAAR